MISELSNAPVLTTERLLIRAPELQDVDAAIPFFMSERGQFVGGGADCDLGRAWRIFAILSGHWVLHGFGSFVLCDRDTGRQIGSAGPWFPGDWPEKELGWTVWDAADEGKGYAFEAVTAIRDFVFGPLGWATAVSYIDPKNSRSRALAERLGCTLDTAAAVPHPDDPCLVYRHPHPGVAA